MSAPHRRTQLVLTALLMSLCASHAAAAEPDAASRTLRAARLESAPSTLGSGRFRLRAQLQPAPAPTLTDRSHRLQLSARLAKAAAASCPMPGTIFSDGFESP